MRGVARQHLALVSKRYCSSQGARDPPKSSTKDLGLNTPLKQIEKKQEERLDTKEIRPRFNTSRTTVLSSIINFIKRGWPFSYPEDSAIWVIKSGKKKRVLRAGEWNLHRPFPNIIFKGTPSTTQFNFPSFSCRTKDNIFIIARVCVDISVGNADKIPLSKGNINNWLDREIQFHILRCIREVSVTELFSETTSVEKKSQETLSKIISDFGFKCERVFYPNLCPPPNIVYDFERLARDTSINIESQRLEARNKIMQDVIRKENQFKKEQTREFAELYKDTIAHISPVFESEGSSKAAAFLNTPNFFTPLEMVSKQLERIEQRLKQEKEVRYNATSTEEKE